MREAARRRRRIAPRIVGLVGRLRQRAGLHDLRGEPAERVGRGGVADQAERFGGAALHERRRIGERGDERIARARVAEQAERERRHLADFGIGIGQQRRAAASTPSASPTWPIASAARRRIRASSSESSAVRSGGGGGGAATGCGSLVPAGRRPAAAARATGAGSRSTADPRDGGSTPSSARTVGPGRRLDRRRRRRARARRRGEQRSQHGAPAQRRAVGGHQTSAFDF